MKIYFLFCFYLVLALFDSDIFQTDKLTRQVQSDSTVNSKRDTYVHRELEINASFINGDYNDFSIFIKKNLIYPPKAKKNKIEGNVIIQFTVNENGDVESINIMRSSGNIDLDNEAIRVVKLSPKWSPAKFDNKAVKQNFVIPIIFNL